MCGLRLDAGSGGMGNYYKVHYPDSFGNPNVHIKYYYIIVKFLEYDNDTLVMLGNVFIRRRYKLKNLGLKSKNENNLFSSNSAKKKDTANVAKC